MKIFINYENIKISLHTKEYQSVNSIINEYLKKNSKMTKYKNNDDYSLDYNGILLNKNLSLEKYNITDNSILNITEKVKGGNSFISFAMHNIILVILVFIIALLPIFILPLGFIPLTSSLIKTIIEKSFNTIGTYLVCTLEKITLFKRMKFIIFIIKYVIFLLMIFVIITFPLILLCVTLKGQTITDNPKNVCGAISAGNISGSILTMIYVFIYILYRGGDYVIDFFIWLFKKSYMLNTTFNPSLASLREVYDKAKYTPWLIIPFLGEGIIGYFQYLDSTLPLTTVVLESITSIGCADEFSKELLMGAVLNKMKELENKTNENIRNENKKIKVISFDDPIDLCIMNKNKCCNPKNYVMIADIFLTSLGNSIIAATLKSYYIYPAYVLIIQALYEYALSSINDYENLTHNNTEHKKIYFRKLLANKIDKIPYDLKEMINNYLENNNNYLVPEIQDRLDNLFLSENSNFIKEIRAKLALLEDRMIAYSKESMSAYIPGGSLFKTVFKIVFLDTLCNVFATAKSSEDVISKMGEMKEIVDMLKAGTSSGLITSFCYLIVVIILIICGIFNIF